MKKLLFSLAVLTLTACGTKTGTTLENTEVDSTLYVSNPVWNEDFPDPTIWTGNDGKFYATATGLRTLLTSTDLAHWTKMDYAPITEETRQLLKSYNPNIWAPDVAIINGQRLMYVTLHKTKEDSRIVVLKETEKPGLFEFANLITWSCDTGIEDTIDPEPVIAEDGTVWLFFGSVGGIHRVELEKDGLSVKKDAEYIHVAGKTVKEDPSRKLVYEGSYLYKHDGYWYLFVSGGFYNSHDYHMLVGRSETLDGEFLDKDGNKMTDGYATTILSTTEDAFFFGPGHNGEIFEDAEGKTYILYHCHSKALKPTSERSDYNPRPMLLQEILWDENTGWPYFQDNTTAEKVLPPTF